MEGLYAFFFSLFLCAKISMYFLNFGSDSILIHEIYCYFSYNPLKIYIRDMPFFFLQKEKDIPNLSFRSLLYYHMANGVVL